ncbi:MAG: SAM-dependent methyltransferase [Flavobacteriaceae bacterium]|nr:SAM-dependent methyltransferase [Flavobacteriaceae bacterium]
MKREIIITSDGSTTIHLPDWNEQYHSKHGAIQEALHVFIEAGLHQLSQRKVSILEIGFGTGLNAFITFLEYVKQDLVIDYVGVEAYPVGRDEIEALNYVDELKAKEYDSYFQKMHDVEWEKPIEIHENFSITKRQQFFQDITDENQYDLIYFDAFGARNQPELWTEEIFQKMFVAMKNGGVLTTYAAKGSVRRAMLTVGFEVERLPGPPGKREMLRAKKIVTS